VGHTFGLGHVLSAPTNDAMNYNGRPGMDMLQMLLDPDEGRFLQAFFSRKASADNSILAGFLRVLFSWKATGENAILIKYWDFLRKRDEARGEFLNLQWLLSGGCGVSAVTPECQARYRELLYLLIPFGNWLQTVRRTDRILNCGTAADQVPVVRFQFQCPNAWETLTPTPEAGAPTLAIEELQPLPHSANQLTAQRFPARSPTLSGVYHSRDTRVLSGT